MPPRKQLTKNEIGEIQSLRGLISAKDIQKKYGIGAPRLYKIWREFAPLTIQKDGAESILQNTDRVLPYRLDTPVQSHIGEQLLFQIQNMLQNIDTTL